MHSNIVGRDREISEIVDSLHGMCVGPKRGVVWISGGPGTGKTSVIQQVMVRAEQLEKFPPFRYEVLDFSVEYALYTLGRQLFEDCEDYYPLMDDAVLLGYMRQKLSHLNHFWGAL